MIHPRHVDYTFRAALINFTLHHRTIRSRSIQRDIEIYLTILPRADKKFHLEARGANIRRSRWLLKLLPRGDYAGGSNANARASEESCKSTRKYVDPHLRSIPWSDTAIDIRFFARCSLSLFRENFQPVPLTVRDVSVFPFLTRIRYISRTILHFSEPAVGKI